MPPDIRLLPERIDVPRKYYHKIKSLLDYVEFLKYTSLQALIAELDSIIAVGPVLAKLANMLKFRLVGVEEKPLELPVKKPNGEFEIQETAKMTIKVGNSDNPGLISDTDSESQ